MCTSILVNKINSSYNSNELQQKKYNIRKYSTDIGQFVNKIYLIQATVKNVTVI